MSPPSTTTHQQPKYIHHYPPATKIYPPLPTTTHHHGWWWLVEWFSLTQINSVLQYHYIGNKASEINKNLFLYFFIEIMFAFLLHLLIENFKPENYCFEIIWCLMFEWIWKDLMLEWQRFWVISNHVPQ